MKLIYKVECPLRIFHDLFIESDKMLSEEEIREILVQKAKEAKIFHYIEWNKIDIMTIYRELDENLT